MSARTVWQALREVLRSNKLQEQKTRVQNALKAHAQSCSDAEFHRVMANFYQARSDSLNPHEKWWEFAEAKQGAEDHTAACNEHLARMHEREAVLQAEQARMARMQEGEE